ncbi:PREDICTED: adenylyl-sulfate kinase 3-like isoform X2 [Nelumbo nucifera]|uniref:Adenylyl-sulfate kinase n=1 Tax=Nelumbo nucifera TaxID=4432 RepID=A0A1U7ZI22_NELNU|nr:PREDICTED: adenylyl-sulfate kinase 3-like isoform X2 [Nelumbo nucifera]
MTPAGVRPLRGCYSSSGLDNLVFFASSKMNSGLLNFPESNVAGFHRRDKNVGLSFVNAKSPLLQPMKATQDQRTDYMNGEARKIGGSEEEFRDDCAGAYGKSNGIMSTVGNSTNIVWHECSVGKHERQKLLQQRGCVVWITGLSGSGKSTLACLLNRGLYKREKVSYILDGDNVRHGLNSDLSFKAEDRAENIRRIAKLFADAGVICIASLISPYRRDRDACRAVMTDGNFIEVFLDVPLHVCEARDPKGLYKLARSGKIKGFTGIDDPYEPPLNSEIVLKHEEGSASPFDMAEKVILYLEEKGLLRA